MRVSSNRTRPAAWFQILVGIAVIGWWTVAAATNGITELEEGRIDIVFHVAAELLMACLLISAGRTVLLRGTTPAGALLSGLALGALTYSSINSPGYFAEQGDWWAVVVFAAIGAAAAVTARSLAPRDSRPDERPKTDNDRHREVRSNTMNQRPVTHSKRHNGSAS